jgi:hypothetical protein
LIDTSKIGSKQNLETVFVKEEIPDINCDGSITYQEEDWKNYILENLKIRLKSSKINVNSDSNSADYSISLYSICCLNRYTGCNSAVKKSDRFNTIKKIVSILSLGLIPVVVSKTEAYLLMEIKDIKNGMYYNFPIEINNQYFISVFYFPLLIFEKNQVRMHKIWNFYIDKMVLNFLDREELRQWDWKKTDIGNFAQD